ncbi:MAG: thiamine diphosphokinase [Bacillota bacterium]
MREKILVVAGGEIISPDLIRAEWPFHDKFIAVDGGGNRLHQLGLVPDTLVGDLDSISPEVLKDWTGKVTVQAYPVEKDETDLELALVCAAGYGAHEASILGASGSRLDHTLANFGLLVTASRLGMRARLVFPGGEARLAGQDKSFNLNMGDLVSLIPLSPEVKGITTKGLKYPLRNESLFMGKTRGVHNEVCGHPVEVTVHEGWLVCFIYRL